MRSPSDRTPALALKFFTVCPAMRSVKYRDIQFRQQIGIPTLRYSRSSSSAIASLIGLRVTIEAERFGDDLRCDRIVVLRQPDLGGVDAGDQLALTDMRETGRARR